MVKMIIIVIIMVFDYYLVSSVRSSSGYHGLKRTYPQPLFQVFQRKGAKKNKINIQNRGGRGDTILNKFFQQKRRKGKPRRETKLYKMYPCLS